ncbi:MAG: hypothetical protein IPJ00_21495 [Saprospirales bacterium]|nr:hypothetical protein [Saprospirales bacterium]
MQSCAPFFSFWERCAPTSNGQEFNKTITKEYDISANGTTYLSNKYGKVDVKTWEKTG